MPGPGRLRQDHHEFQATLGYIVRPCLKKAKQQQTENKGCIKPFKTLSSLFPHVSLRTILDVGSTPLNESTVSLVTMAVTDWVIVCVCVCARVCVGGGVAGYNLSSILGFSQDPCGGAIDFMLSGAIGLNEYLISQEIRLSTLEITFLWCWGWTQGLSPEC
jgi:hypothetical protein